MDEGCHYLLLGSPASMAVLRVNAHIFNRKRDHQVQVSKAVSLLQQLIMPNPMPQKLCLLLKENNHAT